MKAWPWVLDRGSVWPRFGLGLLVCPPSRGVYVAIPMLLWYGEHFEPSWNMRVRGWWLWCAFLRVEIAKLSNGCYSLDAQLAVVRREPPKPWKAWDIMRP